MEEIEKRQIIEKLSRVARDDVERNFGTFNGFGTSLHGIYCLGERDGIKFYIKHSYLVISFIPILALNTLLTYKIGDKNYIVGEVSKKDLKEIVPDFKKVLLTNYLTAFSFFIVILIIISIIVIYEIVK